MRAIIDANPDVVDAKNVNFDNTDTNLAATNTQSAITELNGKLGKNLSVRDELLNKIVSISRETTKTIANNIDISSYKYVEINGYIIPTEIMYLKGSAGIAYTKIHWESGMSSAGLFMFSVNVYKDGHVTLYMTSINIPSINNFNVTIYGYK